MGDIVLSQVQAKKNADAKALVERDRKLEVFKPQLVASGDVDGRTEEVRDQERKTALLAGAPNYVIDLPQLCHKQGCGAPLSALSYVAMINETRFMLWIEGMCPTCMVKRKTIFDPMVGMQAQGKLIVEQNMLMESWRKELMPEPEEDEQGAA